MLSNWSMGNILVENINWTYHPYLLEPIAHIDIWDVWFPSGAASPLQRLSCVPFLVYFSLIRQFLASLSPIWLFQFSVRFLTSLYELVALISQALKKSSTIFSQCIPVIVNNINKILYSSLISNTKKIYFFFHANTNNQKVKYNITWPKLNWKLPTLKKQPNYGFGQLKMCFT